MLSVVVPVFNEGYILKKSVNKLKDFLDKRPKIDYEMIIINDGSADNTEVVAKELTKNKRIIFEGYKKNKGRGYALKYSSNFIKGEKIIYMDADLATGLSAINETIGLLDKFDVVIGSRHVAGSKTKRKIYRMFLGNAHSFLVRSFFPSLNIKESQCGFKGFKTKVFKEVNKEVKSNRWSWDLEFLVKAKNKGYSIKEVPVRWKESEKSSMRFFRDIPEQFFGLLKIKLMRK